MIIIFLGRAGQFLLSLALIKIATSFLSPEEFGKYTLYMSVAYFLSLFFANPVGMFVNRHINEWFDEKSTIFNLKKFMKMMSLLGGFGLIGLWVYKYLVDPTLTLSITITIPLVFLSMTINQTLINCLNMLLRRIEYVALTLATQALWIAAGVALFMGIDQTAELWLVASYVSHFFLAAIAYLVLRRIHPDHFSSLSQNNLSRSNLKEMLRFAWPVGVVAGLMWIPTQGYRFFINEHFGAAQLGIFVAGYSLAAGVLAGAESVLTTYFQPHLYKESKTDDIAIQSHAWNNYFWRTLTPILLAAFFLILTSKQLAQLLLGKEFHGAAQFIKYGVVAETGRILFNSLNLPHHLRKTTVKMVFPAIVWAATVILALLLPDAISVEKTGLGLSLASVLAVLVSLLLATKNIKFELRVRELMKTFLLLVILSTIGLFTEVKIINDVWYLVTISFMFTLVVVYNFRNEIMVNKWKP